MLLHNFFYIICRDGHIIEIRNSNQNILNACISSMTNKGVVALPDYGLVLNGVDISKVLSEPAYEEYIANIKPREYIRKGIWYDGKENKLIRYAPWKEDELRQKKPVALVQGHYDKDRNAFIITKDSSLK